MNIYDPQKLLELIENFYKLVGIKVCIYGSSEEELIFYPKKLSSFCSLLREDEEMDARCKECDRRAFAQCKKSYKQYVYTCHAGLTECMSPVIFDEKIVGYMVLGQIKSGSNNELEKLFERFTPEKVEQLKKCYEGLPTVEIDKLNSAMKILDACTGYEYLKGLMGLSNQNLDVLIGKFINENMNSDLSVPALCSQFGLSHSEVYDVFKRFFESTPAEYVKARRLAKACELLEKTEMPINAVGSKCGFPDYNYFSKVFKKAFNTSPRSYRKSFAKK